MPERSPSDLHVPYFFIGKLHKHPVNLGSTTLPFNQLLWEKEVPVNLQLIALSSNTVNGKRKSLINNKNFALMQPLPMRVVTAPFTCSSYYVTDSTPLPLP